MANTAVTYMGLQLANPIIVSSSSLAHDVAGVVKLAGAGAGAVVLKSLFEEQIEHDTGQAADDIDFGSHPEAAEYITEMGKHLGPAGYLDLIRDARDAVDIPVIASVNCTSPRWWLTYGRQIEQAGADALELNIAIMPRIDDDPRDMERRYVRIVRDVRAETDLPLAVKIGPVFTNPGQVASALADAGADAIVLFNRFYQFDIDTARSQISSGVQFSAPEEIALPLRWVSLLADAIDCDIAASTGVHTGDDAVKMLLAGANAVQICSTVYRNGPEQIGRIVDEISGWMDAHDHAGIDSFRGALAQTRSEAPQRYERLQYIKALTGRS